MSQWWGLTLLKNKKYADEKDVNYFISNCIYNC
jgi:hypothetical protein